MTISEWFLLQFEIHRRFDDWGPIQVFDDGNKRYLSFGTADEQSCLSKQRPLQLQHEYSRAMLACLLMFDATTPTTTNDGPGRYPARVTMLGLGGGSLPRILHHLLPASQLDVVELRAAVVQVARQYFHLPRCPRMRIHTAEAGQWLDEAEKGECQWLLSDLFLADGLDRQQLQSRFLDRCHAHLAEGGWLVLNFWREHRDQAAWLDALRERFPEVLHATTRDGNWIVWARKPGAGEPVAEDRIIRQRASELSASAQFNLWQTARPFCRNRRR